MWGPDRPWPRVCFSLVCGVGCVVWLVLGGVRFFWYCNLNNISVLFKSPSEVLIDKSHSGLTSP